MWHSSAQKWINMGNEVSSCTIRTRGHLRSKPKCISTFPGRSELNKNLRTNNYFIIRHVIGITWKETEPRIAIPINYANPVPNSMLALAWKFLQRIQQKSRYQATSERCIVSCLKNSMQPTQEAIKPSVQYLASIQVAFCICSQYSYIEPKWAKFSPYATNLKSTVQELTCHSGFILSNYLQPISLILTLEC